MRLRNGTVIEADPAGSCIWLPCGAMIAGRPQDTDEYRATAARLGYGADTLAMCREHDPLHVLLCDWLSLPTSYAMLDAAGLLDPADRELAAIEEEAVIAVQRLMRRAGGRLPFRSF